MPTAATGGGRYITHGGELVGTPPILSRTQAKQMADKMGYHRRGRDLTEIESELSQA